jgi:hypothetical protein
VGVVNYLLAGFIHNSSAILNTKIQIITRDTNSELSSELLYVFALHGILSVLGHWHGMIHCRRAEISRSCQDGSSFYIKTAADASAGCLGFTFIKKFWPTRVQNIM